MSKRINWSIDGTLVYRVETFQFLRYDTTEAERTTLDTDIFSSTVVGTPYNGLAFNFPGSINIDKIGLRLGGIGEDFKVEVSNTSSNGVDGSWSEVLSLTNVGAAYVYEEFPITNVATEWLRVISDYNPPTYLEDFYCCHLFGKYVTPTFEFWGPLGAGDSEFTVNYLNMDDAPNNAIYEDFEAFTIKNTNPDANAHTYQVSAVALRDGGDTIVDTYFTVSDNLGVGKFSSINTPVIAPGAFTDELRIYADLTSAQNPADGYHYWYIHVKEIG